MAKARVERFMQNATVHLLKEKLETFGLSTVGVKSVLKLRLEECINELSDAELEQHFPIASESLSTQSESGNDEIDQQGSSSDTDVNDLQREIDQLNEIIKKQEVILDLKKKLASLRSAEVEVNGTQAFSFRDVEEALPTFSGEDNYSIKQWIRSFEEAREIHRWSDPQCFIYARRLLKGTAKLFLRSSTCKTWTDLKSAIQSEFHHGTTPADVHDMLRNRKKRKDESIHQFVLAMQEISSLANIDEEDLINYIIKGIPDPIVNKHILFTAKTIPELKQILKRYEKIRTCSTDIPSSTSSTSSARPAKHTRTQHNFPSTTRCYNCNQVGHVATKCTKPKRDRGTCFKCGKHGHFVKNCNEADSASSAMSSAPVLHIQDSPVRDDKAHHPDGPSGSHNLKPLQISNDFSHKFRYSFTESSGEVTTEIWADTMLDSGSPISFIQEKCVPPYVISPVEPGCQGYAGINNSKLAIVGKVQCVVNVDFSNVDLILYIVENGTMSCPVVLGRNFLNKCNARFVFNSELIKEDDSNSDKEYNDDNFLKEILNIDTLCNDNLNLNINDDLNYNEKEKIREIMERAHKNNDNIKEESTYEMKISLSDTNSIFNCTPRRLPYAHKLELQKILADLLNRKVIRESSSPYASPIVLTKKKNGELRLCVDFRQLNKITLKDNYPLPLIEDHLDRLRGKRYFSLLDLKNGFHHVKVADEQANGQVERVNRVITPMLSKESEIDPGEWTKYLCKVEFAINNTFNKSTGAAPSVLLFGVEQRGMICDKIRDYLEYNVMCDDSRNLDKIRERASEGIVRSQTVNKAYFDKKHKKPHIYKVGDHVMLKNVITTAGINKKLLQKYKGPYQIVKVLPNDRYCIKDLENLQISRIPYEGVASPENMKPYMQLD